MQGIAACAVAYSSAVAWQLTCPACVPSIEA